MNLSRLTWLSALWRWQSQCYTRRGMNTPQRIAAMPGYLPQLAQQASWAVR